MKNQKHTRPTLKTIAAHLDLSVRHYTRLRPELELDAHATLNEIRLAYLHYLRERGAARSLADWRVEKLKAETDKLNLENSRKRGEKLLAEAVGDVWNLMLSNFRARVLQLPSKLMPLISAAKSYGEAEQVMKAGVNECLQELTDCDVDAIAAKDPRSGKCCITD